MELPILVLPNTTGYQASTGAPLNLESTGPTPEAAVAALRSLIFTKLQNGGQVRTITLTDVDSLQAAAKKVGESPMFDEWVQAVEEYRRQHNTIPDAD